MAGDRVVLLFHDDWLGAGGFPWAEVIGRDQGRGRATTSGRDRVSPGGSPAPGGAGDQAHGRDRVVPLFHNDLLDAGGFPWGRVIGGDRGVAGPLHLPGAGSDQGDLLPSSSRGGASDQAHGRDRVILLFHGDRSVAQDELKKADQIIWPAFNF
jgi:hypothetical protein